MDDGAWTQDRSSRPHTRPRETEPKIQLGAKVLRQQRWTCAGIATAVGVSPATIARTLPRVGMSRQLRLEPPPMGRRYAHAAAGDLLHLDTKKLGRIRGIGHRISGQRQHRARGSAGSFCTSRSMITPGWPTWNGSATNAGPRWAPFSGGPSDSFAPAACASGACSRTTARATSPEVSAPHAEACRWSIAGRGHTRRGRTARPSVSSKPPSASGRTTARTIPPRIAPE